MNHLIFKKIEDIESINNSVEKIVKLNNLSSFIIQFYATIFYLHCKNKRIINKKTIEIIQTQFYLKNPTLGAWVKFLKNSILLLNLNIENINQNKGKELYEISKIFISDKDLTNKDNKYNLFNMLDNILMIRNKGFGHIQEISLELSIKILNLGYKNILLYLEEYFNSLINCKLYLTDSILNEANYNENKSLILKDLNSHLISSKEISSDDNMYTNELKSYTLYAYFENRNEFLETIPFILYRDKSYFVYDGVDKKVPIFNALNSEKRINVNKLENAFYSLISEDIDLLNTNQLPFFLKKENDIDHNLPNPGYDKFIGRANIIADLKKALIHRRTYLITISGIGGVGKSALAIKLARDYIENKIEGFAFIIWVSAKKTYLTPKGIETEAQVFSNLLQLLDIILKITNFEEELNLEFKEKRKLCLEILTLDNFLLLVDNFETISNTKEFLDFFEEIGDKSQNSKIILTTRHQLGYSEKIIELKEFDKNEFIDFVQHISKYKFKLNNEIKKELIERLYSYTGGLPLATEFIVGQISENKKLTKILEAIERVPKESILEFSYNESFSLLSNDEKRILFAINLIEVPTLTNISFVSEVDEFDCEEIISKLKKLSFINEFINDNEMKFSILPLTKIFLNKKLEDEHSIKSLLSAKYSEYLLITNISENMPEDNLNILGSSKSTSTILAKAAYGLAAQGDFTKSQEYFDKAMGYNDKDGFVWFFKAKSDFEFSNNLVDEYFEKSVKYLDINYREKVLSYWAISLANSDRHKESIIKNKEILKINSNNKNVFHLIGKSHYQVARNLWKKGLKNEMRAEYIEAKNNFIKSLYEQPNSELEKNHNTVNYYFLGKICNFIYEYELSIKYLNLGLEIQPNNFKISELLDTILNKLKKYSV